MTDPPVSDADLGPNLEAELARLSPAQRQRYDAWICAYKIEWDRECLRRAAQADRILALRSDLAASKQDFRDKLREGAEGFVVLALVAIGIAGTGGVCIGILLALVRAGWRAGATL